MCVPLQHSTAVHPAAVQLLLINSCIPSDTATNVPLLHHTVVQLAEAGSALLLVNCSTPQAQVPVCSPDAFNCCAPIRSIVAAHQLLLIPPSPAYHVFPCCILLLCSQQKQCTVAHQLFHPAGSGHCVPAAFDCGAPSCRTLLIINCYSSPQAQPKAVRPPAASCSCAGSQRSALLLINGCISLVQATVCCPAAVNCCVPSRSALLFTTTHIPPGLGHH
jgi:hypothetical protein